MPRRGQTLGAAFGGLTGRIIVVIIGRQHGILAGTDGVVDWIVSAATA
jgi:hypothetical protein